MLFCSKFFLFSQLTQNEKCISVFWPKIPYMIFLLSTWSAFPHPLQVCFSDFIACILSIFLLAHSAHWFCCFSKTQLSYRTLNLLFPVSDVAFPKLPTWHPPSLHFHFSVNPSLVITFKNFISLSDTSVFSFSVYFFSP